MINLPFKVPFGAGPFTYAGGFFLWWCFCWFGSKSTEDQSAVLHTPALTTPCAPPSLLLVMALGLATEAMITILTPKFISFFLVVLIIIKYVPLSHITSRSSHNTDTPSFSHPSISSVSEPSVPIPLSGSYIYRVGYGLPFWNLSQAVRTIIFNTKNELGQNFGVLCFWVALSCCTIPLFTILMRRGEQREHNKKVAEGKSDTEKNGKQGGESV